MDKIFDNFFDDVFNHNHKNSSIIHKENIESGPSIFDINSNKKNEKIKIPDINLFETKYKLDSKLQNDHFINTMSPVMVKNLQRNMFQNELEIQKSLNKLDVSLNEENFNTPQNELIKEKDKFIQDSLKNKNLNTIENNDNQKNIKNDISTNNQRQKVENKTEITSDTLFDNINLNENLMKILTTAKLVKYGLYFLFFFMILMFALILIKFCLKSKDNDKPIKTRHSINEIEDELNNMREREKLF